MRHFRIDVDSDGLTEVIFDKADATTNTLSSDVFVELNAILDDFDRTPPKGVIIRSGKASGFIAGADVKEFTEVSDIDSATAIIRRGWDTFNRLAKVTYPTLALIKGFCLGGGVELALTSRGRASDCLR